MPGIIWLVLLFLVPFYAVLAIAGGQLNAVFESPEPVWNPLHWTGANFTAVFHDLVGQGAFVGPIFLRTLVYVAIASVLSLAHRLPGRLLRDPVRRPAQGALPGAAHRPVLDQLHDADAGLDRPAADRRLRQPGPRRPAPGEPAGELVGWQGGHRHPGPGLRLHPLPDPGPLRRTRPHRPTAARGRTGSRTQPVPDLPPGHPAAQPAGHPHRDADHRASHDRRLLHQPTPVGAPNRRR